AERGRSDEFRGKIRHSRYPYVARFQERAGRGTDCRGCAEGTDHQGAGPSRRVNSKEVEVASCGMTPLFLFLRARILRIISLRQERSQRLAKSIENNQKNQGRGGGVIPLGRAQAEQENPQLLVEERVRVRLRMLFWCLAIALGALQVWAHRNEMNPDGISYIEMAEAAARGAWHALANAYWSPLYPLLLSVSFRLFHPRMYWEFTSVHVVNFGLYLVDLFCFEFFLKELLAARRA